MKKIRHSKLPITLESHDNLTPYMLECIEIQMTSYGWENWIDEYGNWFRPMKPNPNQLELFIEIESQ
tara:strand:- start:132 stop:332 length:201 start_codon:yes stop_codon:yes gene_type:complete